MSHGYVAPVPGGGGQASQSFRVLPGQQSLDDACPVRAFAPIVSYTLVGTVSLTPYLRSSS